VTHLGSDDDIPATCPDGASDELLRDTIVIGVGGVDEVDAEVKGTVEDRSSIGRIGNGAAEGIGAKTNDRDLEPRGSELPVFHLAGPRDRLLTTG
jgi:hypothetical protein